jgi:hypothetical protein
MEMEQVSDAYQGNSDRFQEKAEMIGAMEYYF